MTRLDRLGRDTRDVLNLVHEVEQRGAFVTVLDPHILTRGEMGHIVLTVLGMVAQMERRFIKERQRRASNSPRQTGHTLAASGGLIGRQLSKWQWQANLSPPSPQPWLALAYKYR